MSLLACRVAIRSILDTEIEDVLVIEHGGAVDEQEIRRVAVSAPALIVGCLGVPKVTLSGNMVQAEAAWAVFILTKNSTDFDVLTEDDGNDRGLIQVKDVVWTASGGSIPDAGDGARYAMLTDDDGTIANREAYQYWDLASNRTVSDGQTLTLQNLEIRINES